MSATLLALPDELLTDIISYLNLPYVKSFRWGGEVITNSRPFLCALALVSRRLSTIACRLLYESVVLHLRDGPHLPLDALRFAQCCEDNPAIPRRLRKIHIQWDFGTPGEWARDLWEAIGLAKNLQLLKLESYHGHSDEKILPSIIEYLVIRLRNLETLVINVRKLTLSPKTFWQICRQPSLRVLDISSPIRDLQLPFDRATPSENPPGDVIPQTNLTSLTCFGQYTDPQVLQLVLSSSPNLVKLRFNWPILITDDHRAGGMVITNGVEMVDESIPFVEPAVMTSSLLPCAKALRELTLLSSMTPSLRARHHAIDLSRLRQLAKAAISIRLLPKIRHQIVDYTESNGDMPSHDWYKSLPSGLQTLEILFDDSCQGLLWSAEELRNLDGCAQISHRSMPRRVEEEESESHKRMRLDFGHRIFEPRIGLEMEAPDRTSWLTDTIKRRPRCLEYLKSFRLVEVKGLTLTRYAFRQLDLTETYPEAFGCPEIGLQMVVRVPITYVPPSLAFLNSQRSSAMA